MSFLDPEAADNADRPSASERDVRRTLQPHDTSPTTTTVIINQRVYACLLCFRIFARKDSLKHHVRVKEMKIKYSCSCHHFSSQCFKEAEKHAETCVMGEKFEVQSKIPLDACPLTGTGLIYSAEGLATHLAKYGFIDSLQFRVLKTLSDGLIRPYTTKASREELHSKLAWKTLEWTDREDLRSQIESIDRKRDEMNGRQAGDPFYGTLVHEIRQLLASGRQRQLPMLDIDESKKSPGRSCVSCCDATLEESRRGA